MFKLAWRDRLRYVGDPDYVDVPLERLLSREYAAGRVESVRQFPEHVDRLGWGLSSRSLLETLHVSAADAEGNLVTATITQGGGFGSCFTVPETGIILGHGMCRLDPRPGRANSVAPGKRPLNNVAPMIVQTPDRDIAIGMPGGRRIISVVPQLVQRMVDFGVSSRQAVVAPRLHVVTEEPVEVHEGLDAGIIAGIEKMGHEVRVQKAIGGAPHGVEFLKTDSSVRAGGGTWAAGV